MAKAWARRGGSNVRQFNVMVDVRRAAEWKDYSNLAKSEVGYVATACIRRRGKANPWSGKRCGFGKSKTSPTAAIKQALAQLTRKVK